MDRIVVVGGGGHAKVVLEILRAAKREIVGFTDPSRQIGDCLWDIPCLGDDQVLADLHKAGINYAFVALGQNDLRHRIAGQLRAIGFRLANAIHPAAVISPSAVLGQGIAIMPGAVINADVVIEDNVIINTGATVDHDCKIGDSVHIAPGVHLSGYVTVGRQSLIGIGSIVGRGEPLAIGEGAIVGAGSVVIHDVPQFSTVVGGRMQSKGAATK